MTMDNDNNKLAILLDSNADDARREQAPSTTTLKSKQ
jgi:hypothetical protein